MDFVLWKPSKPGEPAWDSPWGPGRPGWHIECSAMSGALLGETFDIHGGGIDLVFPHHENEIAQSRCAHGTPLMARFWMHNGFLQVEGQKMAKSLGNFVTIRDLLQEWPGAVLRYQMLMTHYRQPINWTRFQTEQAAIELDTIRALTFGLDSREGSVEPAVVDALTDDLNTPRAIAEIRQMMNRMRTAPLGDNRTSFPRAEIAESIRATLQFLGIDVDAVDLQKLAVRRRGPIDEAAIIALVNARLAARKAKNFKEADRIRDELAAMGIALKDGKDPKTSEPVTTWEVKR
jgi:cysteinyl-tRNA synthetase